MTHLQRLLSDLTQTRLSMGAPDSLREMPDAYRAGYDDACAYLQQRIIALMATEPPTLHTIELVDDRANGGVLVLLVHPATAGAAVPPPDGAQRPASDRPWSPLPEVRELRPGDPRLDAGPAPLRSDDDPF